ncbi:MAG: hypothetical protein AB7V46_09665 [Thermomicrobiales bacterium]
MNRQRWLVILVTVSMVFFPALSNAQTASPSDEITQPGQPETGPGGQDYAFDAVIARHYGPDPDGSVDPTGYWIFEPANADQGEPVTGLPLVLFFHGYFGTDPVHYQAWIDHMVRRGAVVVYPDFQPIDDILLELCPSVCSEDERPTLPFALAAIRGAMTELATGDHVDVDMAKVAATGQSWGAVLSVKYAAVAADEGLPVPSAVMPAMPACICDFASELQTVPASTRVIVLVGRDDVFGEELSQAIWSSMTDVAPEHRDYVRLSTDAHGMPSLVADHVLAATSPEWGAVLDAYDWYGPWKFFDLLTDCALSNTGCEAALGNTPEQRFMGIWSDGVPVIEPEITKDPGT